MPIFHNSEIIFIHIPKTAGSSVEHQLMIKYETPLNEDSFVGFLGENQMNHSLQHCTYKEIENIFEKRSHDIKNYSIFTVVRNPYDRMKSEYFYRLNIFDDKYKICGKIDYLKYDDIKKDFEFFVKNALDDNKANKNNYDNHIITQNEFIEGCDNVHIMKFENLNEDFKQYFGEELTHKVNVAKEKNHFSELYSDVTKELVYEFYKTDFEMFGYDKNF